MTPIDQLARQAGFVVDCGRIYAPTGDCLVEQELTWFAALVRAEALEEAARVCDAIRDQKNELGARTKNHYGPAIATGAMLGAEAIRALATQGAPRAQEG